MIQSRWRSALIAMLALGRTILRAGYSHTSISRPDFMSWTSAPEPVNRRFPWLRLLGKKDESWRLMVPPPRSRS